jgi:hypothetical protein
MRTDFRHRVYPEKTTKSIKFRASWVDPGSYGLVKARECLFELGTGPCGKHVLKLDCEVTEDLLTITQTARHCNDLYEPQEGLAAVLKLDRHERAKRDQRPGRMVPVAGESYTTGWWIFKTTWSGPLMMRMEEPEPHKDILTLAEVVELQEAKAAYQKEYAAWRDRLEVKTFVYKMADVHGRIEIIK